MQPSATAHAAPRFFGQPRGLAYLAFTEAWERFSYYGMTSLLVLYLTQSLLLPGHIEHIAGFGPFRAALEAVFGKMTPLALGSQIFGLYTGLVYFTPVLGGLAADRLLGRRRAVVTGAIMMSAGQIAMAFDQSFLLAITLLILGCGLLKGNISTQVGGLYGEGDSAGRDRGFAIFSVGINVGAVCGPLLCGLLAQLYGWHAGFALSGVLMLCGLATYLAGYRYVPAGLPAAPRGRGHAALTAAEWKILAAIIILAALTIFQSVAYYQNSNICLVWIDQSVDLNLLGFRIPTAWFNSIDPLASILAVPFLIRLWGWQARRGGEPDTLAKIATACWIGAAANLLLAVFCLRGGRVSALVPLLYDVLLGIAFLYYWPPLMAFVSRVAPAQLRATMMGAIFLSLFVADFLVGSLGGLYGPLSPAEFWALHAGIAATGAVLAFMLRRQVQLLLGGA